MELRKALAQIEEVHAQVARTEVFAGYRARTVATTGVIALLAAVTWPWLEQSSFGWTGLSSPAAQWAGFLLLWAGTALVCLAIAAWDLLGRRAADERRRRTFLVVMQFVPVIFVGAVLLLLFQYLDGFWDANVRARPRLVCLLPGLWAALHGLGVLASRPYLPRAVGFAGLFYIVAGLVLMVQHEPMTLPAPWGMGFAFGCGQLLLAGILYLNLERRRG